MPIPHERSVRSCSRYRTGAIEPELPGYLAEVVEVGGETEDVWRHEVTGVCVARWAVDLSRGADDVQATRSLEVYSRAAVN